MSGFDDLIWIPMSEVEVIDFKDVFQNINYSLLSKEKKQRLCRNIYYYQKRLCVICKNYFDHFTKLRLDHDHKTDKVRGLLCNSCNWGLGHFKDSVESLRNAIKYLEEIE